MLNEVNHKTLICNKEIYNRTCFTESEFTSFIAAINEMDRRGAVINCKRDHLVWNGRRALNEQNLKSYQRVRNSKNSKKKKKNPKY